MVWGILALCQCAAKDFGSLLAIRIILGVFEAGFFAGATFYMTTFYTRGEMGFRLAIMQSFAVLASAFSGLISFGVFQIDDSAVKGWQWLFIIEGSMTFITGIVGFFMLPDSPQEAWFLNDREREAAVARMLRDASSEVGTGFNLKDCFRSWNDWKFPIWCIITFTYPVAYATAMNFFPLVSPRHHPSATWLTGPDRGKIGILHCQNQFVDSCTKPCRRSGTPLCREVLRSFPRKNIPHCILPHHLNGGNDHIGRHRRAKQ